MASRKGSPPVEKSIPNTDEHAPPGVFDRSPALLVVAAALVLAGLAAWWWTADRPQLPVSDLPLQPVLASGRAAGVTVHVSGRVADPGLVEVPLDGRIADAIAAAGGALPDADLTAVNLAAHVRDGERIVVLGEGDASTPGRAGVDDGLVLVNVADADAMQALPGVGPVLAARIVSHREQAGPFETPEDLLDVPGIGELKLAGMRDVIAVP